MPVVLTEQEKEEIVEQTEGFAGGDLLNVVLYASSSAVSREGENCKGVLAADFIAAIEILKQAKNEIGRPE